MHLLNPTPLTINDMYTDSFYNKMGKNYTVSRLNEVNMKPGSFNLKYPIIKDNCSDKVRDIVNNKITLKVGELYTLSLTKVSDVVPVEYYGSYEIELNEKRLLSILFSLYYFNGGAQGLTLYNSLTINLETGYAFALNDLFNPSSNYINKLQEIMKKQIEENDITILGDDYPVIKKNQKFYLTPDALVIYYDVYEYTPYYLGALKFKIPFSELLSFIDPNSSIIRLTNM